MSQQVFSDMDPEVTTGLMLAALLDDFKDALMSGLSGSTRPAQLQSGGLWVDTSLQGTPNYTWSMRLFNGVTDLEVFKVNVLSGASGFNLAENMFTVRRVSADTVGAILNLMKARSAGLGQVLTGDAVAKFQIVGRTDTATDPIVAYMQAVAEDDITSSARGVNWAFYSTPVGTNTVMEHLKFISGIIESAPAHKFNALIYGQDLVTTGTDLVVNNDKVVSEISTGTIHGIESTGGTKYKILVNRGTDNRILKHQSTVADAGDRLALPYSADIPLPPGGSATFYYSEAASQWVYICGAVRAASGSTESFSVGSATWTAPFTGSISVATTTNATEPVIKNVKKSVTKGTTYNVVVGTGYCYFGDTFLGNNLSDATLYYLI